MQIDITVGGLDYHACQPQSLAVSSDIAADRPYNKPGREDQTEEEVQGVEAGTNSFAFACSASDGDSGRSLVISGLRRSSYRSCRGRPGRTWCSVHSLGRGCLDVESSGSWSLDGLKCSDTSPSELHPSCVLFAFWSCHLHAQLLIQGGGGVEGLQPPLF